MTERDDREEYFERAPLHRALRAAPKRARATRTAPGIAGTTGAASCAATR